MKKSLAYAVLTTAMAAGMALGTTGVASAAHCATADSPGFSAFGQGGRNSTGAAAVGSPGASECTNDPSANTPQDRAPGQNK